MGKVYTESELRAIGMDEVQIKGIINAQKIASQVIDGTLEKDNMQETAGDNVVQMHQHNVEVNVQPKEPLVPTSLEQIKSYKNGAVVELPPFADGQPFVARMTRPSMLALVKSGKVPNSLLNQATSLFANGAGALNATGKNATNMNDLFEVIDVIVDAALIEPTLTEIRSVGMELTDDQLMAIFSYTQRGVKALEQFRTK